MRSTRTIPAIDDAAARGIDRVADDIDRSMHAALARLTGGLSPAAIASAWWDWAIHLAGSPGKQAQLSTKAWRKLARYGIWLATQAVRGEAGDCCIEPLPQDQRFRADAWRRFPFNAYQQGFLLQQQWWHNATTGIRGVSARHAQMAEFGARQWLDTFAPTNWLATNPEALERTWQQGGANLWRGWQHLLEDWQRQFTGEAQSPDGFELGRDLAATPGKVILRNRLIELVQYEPTTAKVRPEPVLIVPAWIMKYYILDLSTHNSLVRWLVAQGFTVFMISWHNPGEQDRDLAMDDYRRLGVMAALDAIGAVRPNARVHATGYCLGGTLLAIAAAQMARERDNRLRTITLLAAQTDFTEAGELTLFIDESQLAFLEDMMWAQGYLGARQMAGAFRMLRSNDLIWSRAVREYLLGERNEPFDMMVWNADATRMPYRMHAEYLRRLFLDNELAQGRLRIDGRAVALTDIRAPIFAVGTETDHVAPWRSVFKIHQLTDTDVTFVLTNGGHNAGIVAEPGNARRRHRVATRKHGEPFVDVEHWAVQARSVDGSWWPGWAAWLAAHSGAPVAPPAIGAAALGYAALTDAPGSYVLET